MGDALHAISCAAGYNIRWLMRAIARLGIGPVFLRLLLAVRSAHASMALSLRVLSHAIAHQVGNALANAGGKNPIPAHALQGEF